MEADFCIETLARVLSWTHCDIFNTDQGSQFTSKGFIDLLIAHAIQISMDGKGRWADNVYVERLWRTIKQENIYLYSCDTIKSLRASIDEFVDFYNTKRLHQSLNYYTPNEVYQGFWKAKSLVHYSKREVVN